MLWVGKKCAPTVLSPLFECGKADETMGLVQNPKLMRSIQSHPSFLTLKLPYTKSGVGLFMAITAVFLACPTRMGGPGIGQSGI